MSALPQRTRILVKDLLFQERYSLTDTQVDIMSYIFNAQTWAFNVNGHLILTSKKIISDMPKITQKTLESSLRALKSMELIETEIVTVPQWRGAKVRGVKITKKGMEYNSSLYTPDSTMIVKSLEQNLEEKDKKIKELEEIIKNLKIGDNQEVENTTAKEENKQKEPEKEQKKPKTEEKVNKFPEAESLKEFIEAVKREFQETSEPICNMVKGWGKETTFYINSYNKLSIITPNGEYKQLRNPQDINNFWKWLYQNQDRIGKVADFSKELDAEELDKRFRNRKVKIADKVFTVFQLKEADDGKVQIVLKDENNKIASISNGENKVITFKPEELENMLFSWLC